MIEYRKVECRNCGYSSLEKTALLNRNEKEMRSCPECGSDRLEISSMKV